MTTIFNILPKIEPLNLHIYQCEINIDLKSFCLFLWISNTATNVVHVRGEKFNQPWPRTEQRLNHKCFACNRLRKNIYLFGTIFFNLYISLTCIVCLLALPALNGSQANFNLYISINVYMNAFHLRLGLN